MKVKTVKVKMPRDPYREMLSWLYSEREFSVVMKTTTRAAWYLYVWNDYIPAITNTHEFNRIMVIPHLLQCNTHHDGRLGHLRFGWHLNLDFRFLPEIDYFRQSATTKSYYPCCTTCVICRVGGVGVFKNTGLRLTGTKCNFRNDKSEQSSQWIQHEE